MGRVLSRLVIFRRQIILLWRAFWHPATPFYLKALMVGIVAYVISPIDLMPDFLVGLGWIDDILLVTFAVNWIVGRLERVDFSQSNSSSSGYDDFNDDPENDNNGPTIDGTAKRL
ncbi:hypothetical protein MNBD_ALPHA12-624 [hydrothermal vent metagenome]|uniref:DUF1232 domain-containing protein n=1 Tax=hydrothermal vent metagenome TaxID=652676 RepID=A0A3B0TF29_9ZZZZ